MSILRIGVMGCSSFAQRAMIPALKECAATELAGVASRTMEKAIETANQFDCEAISGYEELLEKKDIDAVYIPLPTGLHEYWCTRTLQAGKHILIEKSFAANHASAKLMLDLARERDLLVMENFQFQTHSQWTAIKNWMHSGALGYVHLVRSTFGFPPLPKGNFRWNKDLGGGALLDAGAYMAKASQLLLGTDLKVLGASLQTDPETDVDKYGEAMFRNNEGQVAQVAFGFDYFYQCRVELLGTKGKLSTNRVFTAPPEFEPVLMIERQNETEKIQLPSDNHYVNMWNKFAEEVHAGAYSEQRNLLLDQARILEEIRTVSNAEKQS